MRERESGNIHRERGKRRERKGRKNFCYVLREKRKRDRQRKKERRKREKERD